MLYANFSVCLYNRWRLARVLQSTSVSTLILRLSTAQESYLCSSVVSCTEWIFRLWKQRHGEIVLNMYDLDHLSFFSVLLTSSSLRKWRHVKNTWYQKKKKKQPQTNCKNAYFCWFSFKGWRTNEVDITSLSEFWSGQSTVRQMFALDWSIICPTRAWKNMYLCKVTVKVWIKGTS